MNRTRRVYNTKKSKTSTPILKERHELSLLYKSTHAQCRT